MENWKNIPGCNGLYQASDLGRIKSLKYNKERILKANVNTTGYYVVAISNNGKPKTFKVHQLVAMSFLGHTPSGYNLVVDHINDDKLDNRLDNLQLVTSRFNVFKTQGKYSSKYKGVSWHKSSGKWRVSIFIDKKDYYLGYFKDEYEASLAYQNALQNYKA